MNEYGIIGLGVMEEIQLPITLYLNFEMLLSKLYVHLTFPWKIEDGERYFSKLLGQLFKNQSAKQTCIYGERSFVAECDPSRLTRVIPPQWNIFYKHNYLLFKMIFLNLFKTFVI